MIQIYHDSGIVADADLDSNTDHFGEPRTPRVPSDLIGVNTRTDGDPPSVIGGLELSEALRRCPTFPRG